MSQTGEDEKHRQIAQDSLNNNTDILRLDIDSNNSELTESLSDEEHYLALNDEEPDDPETDASELSPGGILDEETVSQGLTNLRKSADGSQFTFLQLALPGLFINDISILGDYVHLQTVHLPYNALTDISVFGQMPHLLELDLSHNQISRLLEFKAPNNLKSVDLSYNLINTMTDLSEHHYLQKLILDYNQIKEINGISNCKRLVHFSLANNKLTDISGLNRLPIKYLDLKENSLRRIQNIETLKILQHIILSGNQIRSLRGLENHNFLEIIDMEDNEIIDLSEIKYIAKLPLIRELNLLRNPLRELPDYRLAVIFQIQKLCELDCKKVNAEEKVASYNMFNPQLNVIAARDHIMHVVYSFQQPSRVLESTLASIDTPYPMLVLVGPQGAGKKDLVMKLVDEFPDFFGYAISHTTRKIQPQEEGEKDYHFVDMDTFENDVRRGKFLQTYSYHGNLYGLSIDALEGIAKEGLACVIHMELEGVLTLKNTHFEPRYVLILPLDHEAHERRLRENGVYSENQVEWSLKRADKYAEYNREHPGFFDMFINSDSITEAYRRLRRLVMDYLGTQDPSTEISEAQSDIQLLLEKEGTNDLPNSLHSGVAGTQSWSKPSLMRGDSGHQDPIMGGMVMSPRTPSGRGIVEEESILRRASAAKDAVSGAQPSLYEQILQKLESYVPGAPRTDPETAATSLELDEQSAKNRSDSAPLECNNDTDIQPPSSGDSSDMNSDDSSDMTNSSEARVMMPARSPVSFADFRQLPRQIVDALESLSHPSLNPTLLGAESVRRRADSDTSDYRGLIGTPISDIRPGSTKHRVLPPIGQSNETIATSE